MFFFVVFFFLFFSVVKYLKYCASRSEVMEYWVKLVWKYPQFFGVTRRRLVQKNWGFLQMTADLGRKK